MSSASATSFLLEGDVLHIGFHRVGKAPYPEDIIPPAVFRALAQHLQVDLRTEGEFWGDYCYFAGVTGEAFRFLEFLEFVHPEEARPAAPLVERYGHLTMAAMFGHALEAAGLTADLHLRAALPPATEMRRRIVESLRDRQTPAIGLGAFGTPEPFLITGFAEEGEVLLGWSHLQGDWKDDPRVSFEPTGQFRLRDWYEAVDGWAIVTGRSERPPTRQIYHAALERALPELRTTGRDGEVLGAAAMERWAARLEDEAAFAGWTEAQWQKAQSDHGSTAGDLAERRALASSFLHLAGRFLPEAADDLGMAATSFRGAHDTVYEIWETAANTGPFDPDLGKFQDPARRRSLAALVRRLVELDRRGLSFLERAVRVAQGAFAGPAISVDPLLDGVAILAKAEPAAPAEAPWAPENIAMPNAMGMLRAFLGEPWGDLNPTERSDPKLDYHVWMGLSGAAFGMQWDGPHRANLPLLFEALGYDYELWMSQSLAEQTGLPCRVYGWDDNLRRRIFWNLRDRRLPVLLFGCGPWPDWWLVTRAERWGCIQGYGGSSGQGYRPNEPLDHPKNPLRPIDLFEGMKGKQTWTVNLLSRRSTPRPALDDLYRRALAWAAEKRGRQRMALLSADGAEYQSESPFQDWARMLQAHALFPAGDEETLKQRRDWLEGHEVELAERRFYGAGFLDLAAERLGRPELRQAARHFRAIHALMQDLWARLGGLHGPEAHLRLAHAGVRTAIAGLLLEMEREDAAAAALVAG